jgi:predicted RND superfamily exporter protein
MNRFKLAWARFVVTKPWPIFGMSGLLMLLAVMTIVTKPIPYDNSNEMYFLPNDPSLLAFNRLTDLFGDSEYLSIGLQARAQDKDVFEVDTIHLIDSLTQMLEEHDVVTQVRSLSKYQYTHNDDGILATDDLFEEPDAVTFQDLANARLIMINERLALDTLISKDFMQVRLLARTEYRAGDNSHKVQVVSDLVNFIKDQGFEEQGYKIHLAGVPVIGERFETLTKEDMAWINPTMALVMLIILFITFRSVTGTLIPWLVIGFSIVSVSGIQAYLGWPFTAVNSALVPTLIIIGMGVSVHVLVEFYHFRGKGLEPKNAAYETITHLFQPVLFTALTTSIGFIALAITELLPVKQYAYLAAMGPLIIFLVAMTCLPALLSFVPWLPKKTQTAFKQDLVGRITQSIPAFTFNNRLPIVFIGGTALLFSLFFVSKIKVDSNFITYFKQDSWITQDMHYFDEHFKGISNLEVMVDSGIDEGIKAPAFLQRVESLQDYLESLEVAGNTNSLLDFLKQIRQAVSDDNPDFFILPDSAQMTAQLLLLYENSGPDEDLSDLKDFDQRYLRLTVPVINMPASKMTALLIQIEQELARNYSDLSVEITGPMVMYNVQNRYINEGMFNSFSIALLLIGLSFFVLFRSVKYGLIALVPSIVPILMAGGVVTLMGISLDLGTMIVGAMTMGIAVDDAIHVMSRYLLARSQGASVHQAIDRAMNESGRAVVFTSVILVVGFSVMLLGSFIPYINTGLFSAIIMGLALVGDLIVLPALLFMIDGKKDKQLSEFAYGTESSN